MSIKQGNQVKGLSDPVTVSSLSAKPGYLIFAAMDRLPWKVVPDIFGGGIRENPLPMIRRDLSIQISFLIYRCMRRKRC